MTVFIIEPAPPDWLSQEVRAMAGQRGCEGGDYASIKILTFRKCLCRSYSDPNTVRPLPKLPFSVPLYAVCPIYPAWL